MHHSVLGKRAVYPLLHTRAHRFPWLPSVEQSMPSRSLTHTVWLFCFCSLGSRSWIAVALLLDQEVESWQWFSVMQPLSCHILSVLFMKSPLTFQSMVAKKWCLLISSTPSGPAPIEEPQGQRSDYYNHSVTSYTRTIYGFKCFWSLLICISYEQQIMLSVHFNILAEGHPADWLLEFITRPH